MNIRIKMHSELDCALRPDMELIKKVIGEIVCENLGVPEGLERVITSAETLNQLFEQEEKLTTQIRLAVDPTIKKELQAQKKDLVALVDSTLEKALTQLMKAGGKDIYHYDYDLHFNRVVAGLMGSTCYMKDTFDELEKKGIRNILAIAKTVEHNGHHSTFGHSHLTLEFSGIPKALAMILNNEKEYCTSEKSARYTKFDELEPKEQALYYKWLDIFKDEISKKYGKKTPFFDEKGVKIEKLAQENARYMTSIFTKSNMVYTTSFRQLNYLAHWFEDVISQKNVNDFYLQLKPYMQEYIDFLKKNNLYSSELEDHKNRYLSLFGDGIIKNQISGSVYSLAYKASFACLAQLQRHRTIHYNIDEYDFLHAQKSFYTPPILQNLEGELKQEWQNDISSVGDHLPQGMLVTIVEKGDTNDFLLKAYERVCVCAQKEIRDLTQSQCFQFADGLKKEATATESGATNFEFLAISSRESDKPNFEYNADKWRNLANNLNEKAQVFEKLSKGARCTAGYKCASPCGFAEGVKLESEV